MSLLRERRLGWAFALLLAALLSLAVAQGGGAAGQTAQASGPTAEASAAKTVAIRNFAYHPATVRIRRGGRVAFKNSSNVTHTATRAGVFDTRRIKPGSTAVVRFGRRGTFRFHCKIHPFMRGKVVVE